MTVWEPGLGAVAVGSPDAFGMSTLPPDPATIAAVDRLQHEHASRVAAEGAELARALALDAEAHAVPDEVDIADTLLEIARERDAAVVVVASHKISGLRSCVLGSVARKLIDGARRGVRLAGHDPLDEPPERLDPGLGLNAVEPVGVVDVPGREAGQRAVPAVHDLDQRRTARPWRDPL